MPHSGGIGQGGVDQTLRLAVIFMLLGGVFMAIFLTVLIVAIWVMLRYLQVRGLLRSA